MTLIPEDLQFFTASAGVEGVNFIGRLAPPTARSCHPPPGLVAEIDQTLAPQTDFVWRAVQSLGIVEVTEDPPRRRPEARGVLNQPFDGPRRPTASCRAGRPVLPALRVLGLEGNLLDNRAHDDFIPQLEARASENLVVSQFAPAENGRLNVDLSMTLDVVLADDSRTELSVGLPAVQTGDFDGVEELVEALNGSLADALNGNDFEPDALEFELINGNITLVVNDAGIDEVPSMAARRSASATRACRPISAQLQIVRRAASVRGVVCLPAADRGVRYARAACVGANVALPPLPTLPPCGGIRGGERQAGVRSILTSQRLRLRRRRSA
jgi:hypothetical protein